MQYRKVYVSTAEIPKNHYIIDFTHGNGECHLYGRKIYLAVNDYCASIEKAMLDLLDVIRAFNIKCISFSKIDDILIKEIIHKVFHNTDIEIYECLYDI